MIQLNTNKVNLDASIKFHELILNEVGAYIFMKDINGKYVYVNEITRALFNRELEQIIGSDDSEYFDLDELSELVENDRRVLDFGETVIAEEVNTIKSSSTISVYRSIKRPIYNNNQEVIGLLGISTDITDIYNLKEELKQLATIDQLTGAYNRRFFLETAERYFSESNRHNVPFSLIMMDIDFFKKINDSFGHPVGDVVISFIAGHVSEILRKEDVLARVGGEEFAVLLPSTDIDAAQALAERICSSLSKQSISGEWGGAIHPKLSLGVTSHRKGDKTFDEMYVRSDKALYASKNEGRNRVSMK